MELSTIEKKEPVGRTLAAGTVKIRDPRQKAGFKADFKAVSFQNGFAHKLQIYPIGNLLKQIMPEYVPSTLFLPYKEEMNITRRFLAN